MFEKITYISDNYAEIKLINKDNIKANLMNMHLIFEDDNKLILGEVDDINDDLVKARFLGEIINGNLIGGVIRKPSLKANIRTVKKEEIPLILGEDKKGNMLLGGSPFYNNHPVYIDINNFFSNHFAIFGNSGSGKSCGVTRIFQNMFLDERLFPYKSNILLFDSSGEYYNAFKDINSINPNYNYRFLSTNETSSYDYAEKLRIPVYLLNKDDLALLLECNAHSQLPIIERMLKLARIFASTDMNANDYKNHLIAKAIMTILYTNQTSPNKRNDVFSILNTCTTPEFNLEAEVQGVGYTRKFRECFIIDSKGGFSESVLLTEYLTKFIKEEYDDYEPSGEAFYGLADLEKALNFTLISEGWLRNENTYGDAVTVRVRMHALLTGEYAKYFELEDKVSIEKYLSSLLITNGKKYQLVNINLDDVDDSFAKVITKIFTRLVFEFAKSLPDRGTIPFHVIVEEAHRYIQNDTDRFLLGYNIFERVAKEGRKYGVILGLITQRPSELSDTTISQCSSFLIFKMNHPADVDYIKKMVPNISEEIIEKQKSLQSGTCLTFGRAFKIPLIVKLAMPSPEPLSGNCDVVSIWDGNQKEYTGSNEKVKQANSSTVDLNPNIDEEIVEQAQDLIAEEPTSEVTIEEVPTEEKAPQTTVVEDSTTSPQDVVDDSILKEKAEPDNNDELITVVPTT
ncbi:MAG: ATP-binding protein [Bacilli bacterium]|nr:ATP-binding protein [Bacilli bacterium]